MSTLTKAGITELIESNLNISAKDAKKFVTNFFETLAEGIQTSDAVKVSGFGNFITSIKSERPGRNPKTGETIPVTPRRVVTLKMGITARDRINDAVK